MNTWKENRSAGILMPISSLPSKYGIGTFDSEAYNFVDFLEKAKQKFWQVLPLGSTSYGDSPYQNFSAFAGNPYFISLEALIDEGLLERAEVEAIDFGSDPDKADYALLFAHRFPLLRKAFESFKPDGAYTNFCAAESWLDNYAFFMACKVRFGQVEWLMWPQEVQRREAEAMEDLRKDMQNDIEFWKFCQFKFFEQWRKLKAYANEKGVQIIGDIPIYVALDSCDTWFNPEVFYLDGDLKPIEVAGCPPDAFSADGQLWGNPLYRWDYQRETGFDWWKRRISHMADMYDVVRIDHFRGLESYYAIPFGDETAKNGKWKPGPGMAFFRAIKESLGSASLILEDLGFLTEEVKDLLAESGAPGMKVLQFAFDSREESDYLPHNYTKNSVVYTGTHDNDTTAGWFESAGAEDIVLAKSYLNIEDNAAGSWAFIRCAYACVSMLAIVPMQDFLNLGNDARMNTPSTFGGNWRWRARKESFSDELAGAIARLIILYGR